MKNHTIRSKINDEEQKKPTVFLSYNWDDKEYAECIEKEVGTISVFHRDKNSIAAWEDIKQFMRTIKDHDFVIILISKKYIESINCMYEAWQLCVNDKWSNRVMCIVTDESDVYSPKFHVEAVKFWENKSKEHKELLVTISDDCKAELNMELRTIEEIRLHVGEVLKHISERNNPTKEEAIDIICDRLKNFDDDPKLQEAAISHENYYDKCTLISDIMEWLCQLHLCADKCSLALENSLNKSNPTERHKLYMEFQKMLRTFRHLP